MTVFELPELICHAQATVCAQKIASVIRETDSGQILIDASALNKFDSSAVAVLLECRREASRMGKHFEVNGLPNQLRELTKLYGIDVLFD